MKRRDFLWTSAGLTGAFLPELVRAQSRPCPPPSLAVGGGGSTSTSCNPVDAEADWISRSTGAGVIWAHDFRYAAEVDQFRDQSGVGSTPNIGSSDGNCRRITSDGITGGACLELNIPGNPVLSVSAATAANPIRIATSAPHGYAVGQKVRLLDMSGGFSALNDTSGGGGGTIVSQTISAVPSSTTFEVAKDGSGYAAYSGGGTVSSTNVCSSNWWRPFSAIRAGDNGLPVGDIGGVRGEHPLRTWNSGLPQQGWRWTRDYFGHADYHIQYPTWTVDGVTESDPWRGTDFWVQFRCKISASRWNPSSQATNRNPNGKLLFLRTTGLTPLQEIVVMSTNTSSYDKWHDTNFFRMYTGGGYSKVLAKPWPGGPGTKLQPGGIYDTGVAGTTCYQSGSDATISQSCWTWPKDEWVTVLMHVVPGHHYPNWNGTWGSAGTGGDTAVQVWVARQSQLASGYVKVFDAGEFPFAFDSSGRHPPAWNAITPTGYMNNVPAPVGWTQRYDQIVLSRSFVPCPMA